MEETKYCVYKHISPSGKIYIGITGQPVHRRWGNGNGYRNNPHFWNAIQKYGWNSFQHEVLIDGLSKDAACLEEKRLIEELNTTNVLFGYNMTFGGECGQKHIDEVRKKISQKLIEYYSDPKARERNSIAQRGRKHSDETRKKMSESHRATMTDEIRKRMGDAHRGLKFPNRVGHKQSEETKQKIREAKKGKHYGGCGRNPKPVMCIDTGIVYESAVIAAKELGCGYGCIYNACNGISKQACGYKWRYANSYNSGRETA